MTTWCRRARRLFVVGNFAWRAFIALNWPSRLEADKRGVPDRAKSLGDPGKRVWETFKSDAELLRGWSGWPPSGADAMGELRRAQPGVDNREKTMPFSPFADFNQPSFIAGEPRNPLVAQNGAYTRYEIHFNEPEFSTPGGSGWSRGRNPPDEIVPLIFRSDQSRSRPRGAR